MTYQKFQQIPPFWLPYPCPADVKSSGTLDTLLRVSMIPKTWKVNMTADWTVTGNPQPNTAHAELGDEPFGAIDGPPTTEIEIETVTWTGWGFGNSVSAWPATMQWVYTDTAVGDFVIFDCRFGTAWEWTPDDGRANAYTSEEVEISGYVSVTSPSTAYNLVDDVSEPDDISYETRTFRLAIEWEDGAPGSPFFGTFGHTESWTGGDGYSYTFTVSGTVEPTEYWSFDGHVDTTTGDPI
jgi:hypothetical protein